MCEVPEFIDLFCDVRRGRSRASRVLLPGNLRPEAYSRRREAPEGAASSIHYASSRAPRRSARVLYSHANIAPPIKPSTKAQTKPTRLPSGLML